MFPKSFHDHYFRLIYMFVSHRSFVRYLDERKVTTSTSRASQVSFLPPSHYFMLVQDFIVPFLAVVLLYAAAIYYLLCSQGSIVMCI